MKKIFNISFKLSALKISFFGLLFLILILVYSINSGRIALDDKSNLYPVKSFQLVKQWVGTNGEYVNDFLVDDYLYATFGEKGIGIFNRSENIELITNFTFQTNGQHFSFKNLDITKVEEKGYIVVSFFNGEEKGFAIFCIESNNISLSNYFLINFINPKSFCVVENFLYVLTEKGIEKINIFDNSQKKVYNFSLSEAGKIKYKNGFFYIPAYRNGLIIGKVENDNFKIVNNIKYNMSYVTDCYVNNKKILISDRMMGIMLYNLNIINNPELLLKYDATGDVNSGLLNNKDVYIADGINGVFELYYVDKKLKLNRFHKGDYIAYNISYDKKEKILYVLAGANGILVLK